MIIVDSIRSLGYKITESFIRGWFATGVTKTIFARKYYLLSIATISAYMSGVSHRLAATFKYIIYCFEAYVSCLMAILFTKSFSIVIEYLLYRNCSGDCFHKNTSLFFYQK